MEARISFLGILLGALALMTALIHFWAGPFNTEPSLEETVAEVAVSIRDATVAALRGEEVEPVASESEFDIDSALNILVPVLGGLAVILGVTGYALKEPLRVAGGAAVLGTGAIAFQFAALALGAIILVILVAAVISQLGFG